MLNHYNNKELCTVEMFYPSIAKNFTSVVKDDYSFSRAMIACCFPWLP